MDEEIAKLYINIMLFGFDPKSLEYEFTSLSIKEIDEITYKYQNEEEFFRAKKQTILNRLQKETDKYDIAIQPIDIEMGENKIYIDKNGKKIHPLFKEIKIHNNAIKLEDLIKKKMYLGNLKILYRCDKKRKEDSEFESIFNGCPVNLLEKIELNLCDEQDIHLIWEFLASKKRICSIMRFLLFSASLEIMEERFFLQIPKVETNQKEELVIERKIYYPYKDD